MCVVNILLFTTSILDEMAKSMNMSIITEIIIILLKWLSSRLSKF